MMLEQQMYALDDLDGLRALIGEYGWVTLVSATTAHGLVVSHLPIVLDPDADDLTILGHLARADAEKHELGGHDTVIIVAGPHGYISPSLYGGGPYVPTWNFVVAHLHGRPEPLGAEETYDVLGRTVEHFEASRARPWKLDTVTGYARSIAPQAAGFRLRPTRVTGKRKLSQDKPDDVVQRVIHGLDDEGRHGNVRLAREMQRVHALGANTQGGRS
jgi:transcriptional regulator